MANISVGVAKPKGSVSVSRNTGMQGGTYSPQSTFNPQTTVPGVRLQNTYNPQQAASFSQPNLSGVRLADAQRMANTPPTTYDNSDVYKLLADSQAETNRLLAKYNQRVYAPELDYATITAQARNQAAQSVNPFYTKQLNTFLQKQAFAAKTQKEQTATNIKAIEDTLAETLDANRISGERTSEDVATNQANINEQADIYQADSGNEFDVARREQARELAASGSTGGLAQQQIAQTEQTRDTTETRQEQQFQRERDAQELFKTRTFEDLARSGELATKSKEKGITQAKFDLDTFIKNQDFETEEKKTQIELDRQAKLLDTQRTISSTLVRDFIQNISDPAKRQAAYEAYGGLI